MSELKLTKEELNRLEFEAAEFEKTREKAITQLEYVAARVDKIFEGEKIPSDYSKLIRYVEYIRNSAIEKDITNYANYILNTIFNATFHKKYIRSVKLKKIIEINEI